jgi:dihydrofolate synthase/folylpolyglutamate synthase
MRALLRGLGDPHTKFRALHVAGTNGKGSTIAIATALLRAAGVRAGRTTSPHLTSATERIAFDGVPISPDRFVELEARVYEAARALDDPPTFFERVVAMAFTAFADEGVDVALVEVGLGGRLDATNVVEPVACAISRVALDHRQFLGDTLPEIAGEKAGILKSGVPAVVSQQDPEALEAIAARARELGIELRVTTPSDLSEEEASWLRLSGAHQRDNAALACGLLTAAGFELSAKTRLDGLATAMWPGRLEKVSEQPELWLDGAHNADAARALAQALADRGPRSLIVGMTRGHDGAELARALLSQGPSRVWAVQARAPRSRPANEVAADLAAAAGEGGPVIEAAALKDALRAARAHAQAEGGFVVVTGSLYLVGEVGAVLDPLLLVDPELPDF